MNKKIHFFAAVVISVFLITFTLCGCSRASSLQEADTGQDEDSSGMELTVIENVSIDEIEEIDDIETEGEEPPEAMPISVERVYEIIENGEDYTILDVRNPDEYEEGHIEGAVLIPVSELEDRLDEIPGNKPVITYCKAGSRSARAASILVENGFLEVYDMGGITEWIDSGYPVTGGE
jgi:rhodanese-related sulfurtransferase